MTTSDIIESKDIEAPMHRGDNPASPAPPADVGSVAPSVNDCRCSMVAACNGSESRVLKDHECATSPGRPSCDGLVCLAGKVVLRGPN